MEDLQYIEQVNNFFKRTGRKPHLIRVITDTSHFTNIDYGDVLFLEKGRYLVLGHEREGRFGLDDEIKPWVKKAIDLDTGERKVIKLEFHEKFQINIGSLTFECFRSPKKEAHILDLVRQDPNFMKGHADRDVKGNTIRIIDFIPGPTLDKLVGTLSTSHYDYYRRTLPGILDLFRPCLIGLGFLHRKREKHGDVRRDHLIYSDDRSLVWIDFDYSYLHGEFIGSLDLVGVGNILAFLIGGGDHSKATVKVQSPEAIDKIGTEDMSLIFQNRIFNLRKIFPYISEKLNRILIQFSIGATSFYNTIEELLEDFDDARQDLCR